MSGSVSMLRGNALNLPLADQSVALICSSPPYWALRDYRSGEGSLDGQLGSEPTPHHFLANLWRVMDECWRVLRDDGSAWINLGDKMVADNRGSAADVKRGEAKYAPRGPAGYPDPGGLRRKSRMELPHRFALGCQWPAYRRFEEEQAGLPPTVAAPQWILRMDVVWAKPNGMPESVTDRCRASHEYWLHLVKSERYFASIDEVREEHTFPNDLTRHLRGQRSTMADGSPGTGNTSSLNPLGKVPGSVWSVASEPLIVPPELGVDHFAAFPSEFPRRIVLGWSPSGVCVACGDPRRPVAEKTASGVPRTDHGLGGRHTEKAPAFDSRPGNRVAYPRSEWSTGVERSITGYACSCPTPDAPTTPARVLDPFSGTGTTAVVAAALGRHGIGVELSADYLQLARWRDDDGGLRCKALGVEKPARQLDGQLSLLGGGAA